MSSSSSSGAKRPRSPGSESKNQSLTQLCQALWQLAKQPGVSEVEICRLTPQSALSPEQSLEANERCLIVHMRPFVFNNGPQVDRMIFTRYKISWFLKDLTWTINTKLEEAVEAWTNKNLSTNVSRYLKVTFASQLSNDANAITTTQRVASTLALPWLHEFSEAHPLWGGGKGAIVQVAVVDEQLQVVFAHATELTRPPEDFNYGRTLSLNATEIWRQRCPPLVELPELPIEPASNTTAHRILSSIRPNVQGEQRYAGNRDAPARNLPDVLYGEITSFLPTTRPTLATMAMLRRQSAPYLLLTSGHSLRWTSTSADGGEVKVDLNGERRAEFDRLVQVLRPTDNISWRWSSSIQGFCKDANRFAARSNNSDVNHDLHDINRLSSRFRYPRINVSNPNQMYLLQQMIREGDDLNCLIVTFSETFTLPDQSLATRSNAADTMMRNEKIQRFAREFPFISHSPNSELSVTFSSSNAGIELIYKIYSRSFLDQVDRLRAEQTGGLDTGAEWRRIAAARRQT